MVAGRPAASRSLVIFDLDGTILSVNSFRVWVAFMLRAPFTHLSWLDRTKFAAATGAALAARKLHLMGHKNFKRRLQRLWRQATAGDNGRTEAQFIRHLQRYVRPELTAVLNAVAQGKIDAIMATAAAGDYADGLGRALGFKYILSTASQRAADVADNIGHHKCSSVLAMIKREGWDDRPRVLFTDHRDDLPLVNVCQDVFWFGSPEELDEIARTIPGVQIRSGFSTTYTFQNSTHLGFGVCV